MYKYREINVCFTQIKCRNRYSIRTKVEEEEKKEQQMLKKGNNITIGTYMNCSLQFRVQQQQQTKGKKIIRFIQKYHQARTITNCKNVCTHLKCMKLKDKIFRL